VDPQGDVGRLVLGGETEQLGRQQRAVVVVECAVEHEHALREQLASRRLAERGYLGVFFCHASSLSGARRSRAASCSRRIRWERRHAPSRMLVPRFGARCGTWGAL